MPDSKSNFEDLPDATKSQIRDALVSQKKILAIKIFYDATGSGLKESKDTIEALIAEKNHGADLAGEKTALQDHVLDLIFQGKKLKAIKAYKDASGVGLKEAKLFIEKLTVELAEDDPSLLHQSNSGCSTVVLILLSPLVVFVAWLTNL